MIRIRDAIIATLQKRLPEIKDSIEPYVGLLDERTDGLRSYKSPGILVCPLPIQEVEDTIAPWELVANFALVVTVKGASAGKRDADGWNLAMRAAAVAYRNTWSIEQLNIRPAIITGLAKNEQLSPDGTPTGQNYWTILFYNWIKFEALLDG